MALWPSAPAGLYCAGLGKKQPRNPITVASVQSVYKKAPALGWRSLVLVDEAHLLAPESDSMYRRLIRELREINPRLRVIGFTASPFRTKTGLLTEGADRIFTDVAVEVSLAELLDNGHIAPLVSKASVVQADISDVRVTAGEFNSGDLERAMDKEALTNAALDEVFALAGGRKSWLFFCSGIKHAEHVRDALRARGLTAESVTGNTPPDERDAILAGFKTGRIRAVSNAQILTTGFDAPGIDLIVMLRPTMSPGLWLQMLGRGLRTSPGKKNCLCLDYTDNTERLGPITHVKPPRASAGRGQRPERVAPTCLICPKCRMASPLGSPECGECGHTFERPERVNHETRASDLEVMPTARPADDSEWLEVDSVRYMRHEKEGKIPSMRVEYTCGVLRVSEWVCLAHPEGYALGKARDWWRRRSASPPPSNIGTAVMVATSLAKPRRVRVKRSGKFWEVVGYEFEDRPAEESAA